MNVIEALQALKDGKQIQEKEWVTALYLELRDGEICFDDGDQYTFFVNGDDLSCDKYKLYIEPLKLTPEEIKALKLAQDCGFADISRSSETDYTILFNYAKFGMDYCLCAHEVPSFTVLHDAKWINGKGQSINDLLKDEV